MGQPVADKTHKFMIPITVGYTVQVNVFGVIPQAPFHDPYFYGMDFSVVGLDITEEQRKHYSSNLAEGDANLLSNFQHCTNVYVDGGIKLTANLNTEQTNALRDLGIWDAPGMYIQFYLNTPHGQIEWFTQEWIEQQSTWLKTTVGETEIMALLNDRYDPIVQEIYAAYDQAVANRVQWPWRVGQRLDEGRWNKAVKTFYKNNENIVKAAFFREVHWNAYGDYGHRTFPEAHNPNIPDSFIETCREWWAANEKNFPPKR